MAEKQDLKVKNVKKRQVDAEQPEQSDNDEGYSTSSSYAPSAIDVSFNYVGLTEIDFMALKRLFQQLYHTHAPQLDLGALADHVIKLGTAAENAVGTVVKVEDDEDGDPFALASAISLSSANEGEAATKTLRSYYDSVLSKSTSNSAKAIKGLLERQNVVQILHERMINMPPQIMPALYRILFDEIKASPTLSTASHFLFFSRTFSTEALSEDEGEAGSTAAAPKSKKAKKQKRTLNGATTNQAITKVAATDVGATDAAQADEMGLFHPEDALIAKLATDTLTFRFPAIQNSDDSFNAPMFGRIAVIKNDAATIERLLAQVTEAFTVSA